MSLSKAKDSGIYLSPIPKREKLYSNLLEVTNFAERIYLADTDFRDRKELWNELNQIGERVGGEWILKGKQIMSFYNLEEYPWYKICDEGTIDSFESTEWANSSDLDFQRDFVRLLNQCLTAKLYPKVRYNKKGKYYFFSATQNLSALKLKYKSLIQKTSRIVFQGYPRRNDPTKMAYYRHSAFIGKFLRLDNKWYIEITPTYHFTWNGSGPNFYSDELIKKIKQMERNPAVLGQVVMWADYLKERKDLLTNPYPFISFGSLVKFDLEDGLDDKSWLGREETDEIETIRSSINQLPLF